jgi:hypothetical protein
MRARKLSAVSRCNRIMKAHYDGMRSYSLGDKTPSPHIARFTGKLFPFKSG